MKIIDVIQTATSNILRSKSRSFLTIVAIFIGVFTILMVQGVKTGVNNYISRQVDAYGGEDYMMITGIEMEDSMAGSNKPKKYDDNALTAGGGQNVRLMTPADVNRIRGIEGITSAHAQIMTTPIYIYGTDPDEKYLVTTGTLPVDSIKLDIWTGRSIDVNSKKHEIVITPDYVSVLGYTDNEDAIGKTVTIAARDAVTLEKKEFKATIVGVQNKSVISISNANIINKSLATAIHDYEYAHAPDELKNVAAMVSATFDESYIDNEDKIKALQNRLKEDWSDQEGVKCDDPESEEYKKHCHKGYAGITIDDMAGMFQSFFDAILTVFTIFGYIALLAAAMGIINTLFMAVQERTREIGLMKAMGLSRFKIFMMFSVEAISLGFWGSVLGIVVANIARIIGNKIATETFLSDLPGFTLVEFTVADLIGLTLIIMLVAFIAGTLPANRAAQKDPIDALRYE